MIWYDNLALGQINKGLMTEEKSWLDIYKGVSCPDSTFYSANSSLPVEALEDPHPFIKYTYDAFGNQISIKTHNIGASGNADQTISIGYDTLAHCLPVTLTTSPSKPSDYLHRRLYIGDALNHHRS